VILIKRVAQTAKLSEFLAKYSAEKPTHHGFISEYLTRVNTDVPLPLRSLDLSSSEGITFINVAFWKSEADFIENFQPEDGFFDKEIECEPRVRITLKVEMELGDALSVVQH
jgi:hypothetical protein